MQQNLFIEGEMTTSCPTITKPNVTRSTFYEGDCIEEMSNIEDKSIDMILCDLPYGITACKWDSVLPLDKLWLQYNRIIKDNAAIILFGGEPFSSVLRLSNLPMFRYDWIWDKVQPTGAVTAKKRPMQLHEYISVFYRKQPTYNRQMSDRKQGDLRKNAIINKHNQKDTFGYVHLGGTNIKYANDYDFTKVNPKTIIRYSKQPTRTKNLHPTQKPVELLKYLVKTYTNEFETVLDNTMGSGSTGVACKELNRHFIGIEKDEKYFDIAVKRINKS